VAGFVDSLLSGFPVWALYLVVFLLPFLEASILLGFVFPGETALVFGGAVGTQNGASLGVLIVLAVAGAITGDAVGYAVGRRFGARLQLTRLGRIVGEERWIITEAFLVRRGGTAVFFGRWTALLRAMVPGAAGMARLPYRTFFLYNALGGTLWAVACVLGGYVVGEAIGKYVTSFGYVILGLAVLAIVVALVHRRRKRTPA
jgi:membrane protein DedA with SNARE-associated domain